MLPATHVALLRGINVGGKNVLRMEALAATFEEMGLSSVRTYIQSGNVLFGTKKKDARALEASIERALRKAHDYDAKVVVRSREEMARVVRGFPKSWRNPSPSFRYNVLFLRHGIDDESILDDLGAKPGIETVTYRPGVLYWSAHMKDLPRTAMVRISARAFYQELTARNLNTTRKLFELLAAEAAGR